MASSLGDGGEWRLAGLGLHCRFCAGHMHNALHGREAWRSPGKCDRGRWMAGSQITEAVVFSLSRCLAGGNEAELDDHARDMAFDQLAVRKSGRGTPFHPLRQDACGSRHARGFRSRGPARG
jgi:hypothetical protein